MSAGDQSAAVALGDAESRANSEISLPEQEDHRPHDVNDPFSLPAGNFSNDVPFPDFPSAPDNAFSHTSFTDAHVVPPSHQQAATSEHSSAQYHESRPTSASDQHATTFPHEAKIDKHGSPASSAPQATHTSHGSSSSSSPQTTHASPEELAASNTRTPSPQAETDREHSSSSATQASSCVNSCSDVPADERRDSSTFSSNISGCAGTGIAEQPLSSKQTTSASSSSSDPTPPSSLVSADIDSLPIAAPQAEGEKKTEEGKGSPASPRPSPDQKSEKKDEVSSSSQLPRDQRTVSPPKVIDTLACPSCSTQVAWFLSTCSHCLKELPQKVSLTVRVIQARFLTARNFNGTSDPLCHLYLSQTGQPIQKLATKCQIKTMSPVWNEDFKIEINPTLLCCELEIKVMTWGVVSDEPLGQVSVDLRQAIGRKWYRLAGPGGELQLEIMLTEHAIPLGEGLKFKIHFDKLAGTILAAGKVGAVVTSIGDTLLKRFKTPVQAVETPIGVPPPVEPGSTGSAWKSYRTYSVKLDHVDEIFGKKRQPWNPNYHNAVKIFGPGPTTPVVRAGIIAEHKSLFSTLASQAGIITCGEQFMNLVNYGVFAEKRRRFTYVIVGSRIVWSETSGSLAKDFLSKHAVLANAAFEVVFSGEFFIVGSPTKLGAFELVIDNNSGTYAPSASDLPKIFQLFHRNFPDILVHAIEPANPRMAVYKQLLAEGWGTTSGFNKHKDHVISVEEQVRILELEDEEKTKFFAARAVTAELSDRSSHISVSAERSSIPFSSPSVSTSVSQRISQSESQILFSPSTSTATWPGPADQEHAEGVVASYYESMSVCASSLTPTSATSASVCPPHEPATPESSLLRVDGRDPSTIRQPVTPSEVSSESLNRGQGEPIAQPLPPSQVSPASKSSAPAQLQKEVSAEDQNPRVVVHMPSSENAEIDNSAT